MAHQAMKSGYLQLTERLNQFPQGAPPSELLYKILKLLFRENEASLVALLPIKPFTAQTASRIWKTSLNDTKRILNELSSRAILLDVQNQGKTWYTLPPPMAGFFEFSLMRIRSDIDQQYLASLFYEYLNVEEDFIKNLFTQGETQLGRTFVQESVLSDKLSLHVLDYERASEVIKKASHRGIGICYCRHKMKHMHRACDAPMEICMTFNNTAASLIRNGYAREVETAEALDLLQIAYENHLVQFGENVQNRVSFICNCCGCCCEALIAQRRFGFLHPVHTTNFLPVVANEKCNGCARCVEICPVEAMTLISANLPEKKRQKIARLQEEMCLGCGVCVSVCKKNALVLESRPQRVIPPLNTTHRVVLMAIERGKLAHLIFDKKAMVSHRIMAAILNVIIKLSPAQKLLASQQFKSRYLVNLLEHVQV
ncbi:MAG: 4Fe-4S dicluster domain-containing protein [bacterium]|nr:MAG: 4Fe-4S dicluster domain-containing protein [bacterium]